MKTVPEREASKEKSKKVHLAEEKALPSEDLSNGDPPAVTPTVHASIPDKSKGFKKRKLEGTPVLVFCRIISKDFLADFYKIQNKQKLFISCNGQNKRKGCFFFTKKNK